MHFDYDHTNLNVLEDILVHIAENLLSLKSFRYMPMIRKSAQIDVFMRKISTRQTLTQLWLPGPMLFFTERAFAEMAKGLVHLEELALCQSGSVTDVVVMLISRHLSKLRVLNLRGCQFITDAGIDFLRHNSSLSRLDLRECIGITPEGVLDMLRTLPEIRHVDMSAEMSTEEEFFARVGKMKDDKPELTVSVDFTFTENKKQAVFRL